MEDSATIPSRVVRFYGSLEYALDTIGAQQITLIHTSKLNDPFDPYLFFETDFSENYKALIDYISEVYPHDLGWFINVLPVEGWQKSINDLKEYFNKLRDQTYIFSTVGVGATEHPKDSLYMWSHYAYGHRGLAIEFDTHEIGSDLVEMYNNCHAEKINIHDAWVRVDYKNQLSPITKKMFFDFAKGAYENTNRKTDIHKYYDSIAKTKSTVWETESEWRLLWQRDDTKRKIQKVPINERAIVSIYIGLSASGSFKDDILFESSRKYPNANVFAAEKQFGSFALKFRQLR